MEIHLCEEHAKMYLSQEEAITEDGSFSSGVAEAFSEQLPIGQAAEDLARLDQRECPVCGITFYEFRSRGRLGCPNDYDFFFEELEPLLVNIHGETEHKGKIPERAPNAIEKLNELIRLRREIQDAIQAEEYEHASKLRDAIRIIEEANTP